MPDETSLVNIGELSKPATVLVEKISDAIGGILSHGKLGELPKLKLKQRKLGSIPNRNQ